MDAKLQTTVPSCWATYSLRSLWEPSALQETSSTPRWYGLIYVILLGALLH
ncbi:hypothetical protein SERLA73DRAFT_139321 [Serpula lacrymans var. lacrymans S7.3]|uniref:Uncharacterized protein n=1 Tax=Serpula lacrymans var. lacrymans (strain S7.3) TaxID=936435 RepID=F8Q1Y2_SERL3|nr:hypothetical protein SERLA73DRAFT_139321 [Serpula lacrymans var. lacrymans S7.3]